MANIANKNVQTFDIDHVYVVDCGDDNAIRKMLKEAIVESVVITADGKASFKFKVAGTDTAMSPENMVIFYDANSYRASGTPISDTYTNISSLLMTLGIPDALFYMNKANPNATQFLVPLGYIINDKTMVEPVEFPEQWTFKRTTKTLPADSPDGEAQLEEVWEHDANFYDHKVYMSREEALKGHKIKLLKLDGSEVEYGA